MQEEERLNRRTAFGEAAEAYDTMRPGYPAAAIARAMGWASLAEGECLLEIGCGTGQATTAFAAAGLAVTALEPDAALAARARRRLSPYPKVSVIEETFEEFVSSGRFDAILAATSFHWIAPPVRARRCAELLPPGGHVILLANLHPMPYTGFFTRVQEIYERLVPQWGAVDAIQLRTRDSRESVIASLGPSFRSGGVETFEWTQRYTADEYLQLLSTYSDHRRLPDRQRERLFADIHALIVGEFAGTVERPYRTVLHVLERVVADAAKQ